MKLPLLAIPIALLSACAATAPQGPGARTSRTDACVLQSAITGFKPLDDSHIVLYDHVGHKGAYLAEILPGCFDLSNQTSLAAIDGDGNGRICGYGRDDIAYRQFGRLESCRVMKLEQLTDERLAALLEKKTGKPHKVVIQ
jgi:hypothetical protein